MNMRLMASFLAVLTIRASGLAQVPQQTAAKNGIGQCGPAVFLTLEQGKIAAVDWVTRTGNQVHTRVVEAQSHIIDATIDLRADGTAAHSSVILAIAGDEPDKPIARDLGEGAVYWSPRIVSSVEQAIARAGVVDTPSVKIPTASLYSNTRAEVTVERLDPEDWVVSYQDKTYRVLTDEHGCMLAASLPEYGVVIERRTRFAPSQYPLWTPYAAPPDGAYRAVNVTIPAPKGHKLAGTLTLPANGRNVPAAVLITGLSPHERNNGSAPWMTFRDISDALTRAGIAVLRVDDRGVGESSGDQTSFTSFDKADDVHTEVGWLRSHPGVDPRRIMLVGYSEGGLIAPMVAAKDPSIAAVITLAGPGVPGLEVARYQVEQPILRDPSIPESERNKEFERQFADALKDLTPHMNSYLRIDPTQYDRQVGCPALIIQGAADATVPLRSAERIATAMRSNGNRDVTVRIFPGVSHSLLPDPVGLPSGWAALPAFLTPPDLLGEVTRWSLARLKPEVR